LRSAISRGQQSSGSFLFRELAEIDRLSAEILGFQRAISGLFLM
jgi:hypothetical protein